MRVNLAVFSVFATLGVAALGCSDTPPTQAGAQTGGGAGAGSPAAGGTAGGAGSAAMQTGGVAQAGASGSAAGDAGMSGGGGGAPPVGGNLGAGGVDVAGAGGAGQVVGGASKCAQSTFQLCEDFESGALDKATWTVSGLAPIIDGEHVARCGKALHIKDPSGMFTHITEKKTFREPDNTYYGRIFIYFKSLPTPTATFTYSHWTILAATGDGPGAGGEIRFGGQMQNGVNRWGTGTDNQAPGATGDWTNIDQDPAPDGMPSHIPSDTWLCMEWMHAGPDTNETKVWWDGAEHPSIATTKTEHGTKLARAKPTAGMGDFILPNFTALWLGWQAYQGGGETFELWLDEIAIDHARIGCGN